MLSNISDLFTMASLVICMLLSGIIFYYLRTRISMLEQSVMDQAQLLQQVVTSLKTSQYRQLNVNHSSANMNTISVQHGSGSGSGQQDQSDNGLNTNKNEKQMNLIPVSDDSDATSDSSDTDNTDESDDSDNDSENETSDGDNMETDVCAINVNSLSKIIDLSAITSSSNSFKPYSSSHSEIKVIELKSNVPSHSHSSNGHNSIDVDDDDDEDDVTNSSDDDGEYDDDDDDDHDDDGDYSDNDDNDNRHNVMKNGRNENENKEDAENRNQNGENDGLHNNSNNNSNEVGLNGVNNKKMKSIIIEDVTNSVSLDEMKNMPVNSLRSLAKTKLSNLDVPTINKMSKKEILKALHD